MVSLKSIVLTAGCLAPLVAGLGCHVFSNDGINFCVVSTNRAPYNASGCPFQIDTRTYGL
ncbi:hypothetical protein LX36DRAFT_656245 [Colletotrichum falcatum]|nr:hypothetical protein LX36DRAFT_656245 [Colletotrichum falcatum]